MNLDVKTIKSVVEQLIQTDAPTKTMTLTYTVGDHGSVAIRLNDDDYDSIPENWVAALVIRPNGKHTLRTHYSDDLQEDYADFMVINENVLDYLIFLKKVWDKLKLQK